MKTKPTPSSSVSNDDDGLSYSSDKKKIKKKMKKASEDNKRKIPEQVLVSDSSKTSDKRKKFKKNKQTTDNMDVAKSDKKVKKVSSKKKRKGTELPEAETTEVVVSAIPQDAPHEGKSSDGKRDKKTSKSKKNKRDKKSRKRESAGENVSHSNDADQQSGILKSTSLIDNGATLFEDEDEVYEMSSGDEDEATGMKRWISIYHSARPGAEVLMEDVNDFLVDYAAQKEQEKKKREEEAAEGGWTVVTHQKGRKKTTEAESGTTVGSVAPAAVMDKLSKKKDKEVAQNFYSFQKREAKRNEIMMLQSKFEQDKKRIQELRAARKFRPY